MDGFSIEDLEVMEQIFSASNGVARTIRYATKYHWMQALDLHFRQWDEEKYLEISLYLQSIICGVYQHFLGKFIYNNYKQCLSMIDEYTPEVEGMKYRLGITDLDIDGWLESERKFLKNLKDEP